MNWRNAIARSGAVARVLIGLLLVVMTAAPATALQTSPGAATPAPIAFPRDDGAHDSGIEWWYFTGHLFTAAGDRYGFEYVVFRARQGALEGYIAHVAVTDNPRDSFHYDQRLLGAKGVAGNAAPLDLDLDGWTMRGGNGQFALGATIPGYALRLNVATTKPAALHEGDGYIEYGDGTASYYYSWTRLAVNGTVDLGSGPQAVTGEAWMDHQWGDFATYREGGWDWFSLQLDDKTDIMLYLIRAPDGTPAIVDGSIIAADGSLSALGEGDFQVTPTGTWTSPETGTTYPSGWTIAIPEQGLTLTVTPSLRDQELDTRSTTGVIYWEGEATIAGTDRGAAVSGLGYVELTGYAPYVPVDLGSPAATPGP